MPASYPARRSLSYTAALCHDAAMTALFRSPAALLPRRAAACFPALSACRLNSVNCVNFAAGSPLAGGAAR